MPGFLMFEEYGITGEGMLVDLGKAALRRLPMAWVAHGIKGEYNVDVDPIAMLRGDGTDLFNLGEPFTAWISVTNVTLNLGDAIQSDWEDHLKRIRAMEDAMNVSGAGAGAGRRAETHMPPPPPEPEDLPRGRLDLDVEIDVSLPQLIRAALEEPAGRKFAVADVHMCTTAQIDMSQIDSYGGAAAGVIKTLVNAMMFNIVPYLTISMRDVKIESIGLDGLRGDQDSPPTASLTLEFEKVKCTYHVINGSNMSLFDVSSDYDFNQRTSSKAKLLVGSVVNPFG